MDIKNVIVHVEYKTKKHYSTVTKSKVHVNLKFLYAQ